MKAYHILEKNQKVFELKIGCEIKATQSCKGFFCWLQLTYLSTPSYNIHCDQCSSKLTTVCVYKIIQQEINRGLWIFSTMKQVVLSFKFWFEEKLYCVQAQLVYKVDGETDADGHPPLLLVGDVTLPQRQSASIYKVDLISFSAQYVFHFLATFIFIFHRSTVKRRPNPILLGSWWDNRFKFQDILAMSNIGKKLFGLKVRYPVL